MYLNDKTFMFKSSESCSHIIFHDRRCFFREDFSRILFINYRSYNSNIAEIFCVLSILGRKKQYFVTINSKMLARHRCDTLLQPYDSYLILWQIKNSGFKPQLTFRAQTTMLRTSQPHVSGSRSRGSCSIHKLFLSKNHKILKSLLVSYATVIVKHTKPSALPYAMKQIHFCRNYRNDWIKIILCKTLILVTSIWSNCKTVVKYVSIA